MEKLANETRGPSKIFSHYLMANSERGVLRVKSNSLNGLQDILFI